MTSKNEDSSTQQRVLEIYAEAILKIDPNYFNDPINIDAEKVRKELIKYTNTTRQTRQAIIARRALKAASYERIYGPN